MVDQTVTCSADTFIDESATTTNRSSEDHLNYRSGGSDEKNDIWTFDVSSLDGKKWDLVTLNLTYFSGNSNPNTGGGQIHYLSHLEKAVVIAQCTWDEFATSSTWNSSGAENGNDNHHATRVIVTFATSASADDVFVSPDITDIIKRAINTNSGTLNLIMYGDGPNAVNQQFDSIETTSGSQAFLQFTNVENVETTTSSNPSGVAVNVAVPSATVLSQSGRPPIAGADRQVTASVLHDGVEPMTILSITLKGAYGSDN